MTDTEPAIVEFRRLLWTQVHHLVQAELMYSYSPSKQRKMKADQADRALAAMIARITAASDAPEAIVETTEQSSTTTKADSGKKR